MYDVVLSLKPTEVSSSSKPSSTKVTPFALDSSALLEFALKSFAPPLSESMIDAGCGN